VVSLLVKRARILVALAALASCRAPIAGRPAGKASAVAPSNVVVRELRCGDQAPLETTCVPTGPELCFDATDNNCNGVIDEGCGLETGPLQFVIAWPEGSDVDLEVTDPMLEKPSAEGRTESGLVKGRDCGRAQSVCHGQNVENVWFAGDRPPPGRYRVDIKVAKGDDARFPVQVRLGARLGVKTFAFDLKIESAEDAKGCEITVQ
jgi:hypothetical protein